jgi:c-di-GMP-binding flagellar brake protein YcgR
MPPVNRLVAVQVEGSETVYRSRIEDVGDGTIFLALPSDGHTEHRFAVGSLVTLEWFADRGMGRVAGVVTGHADVGVPALVVELDGAPELVQRREHARAGLMLGIDVWPDAADDEPVSGITLDVSGGGLRAVINAPLEEDSLLRFSVNLLEGKVVSGLARVVDVRDDDVVAFELHDLVPADRERLIRAVFASYRESRVKGLEE